MRGIQAPLRRRGHSVWRTGVSGDRRRMARVDSRRAHASSLQRRRPPAAWHQPLGTHRLRHQPDRRLRHPGAAGQDPGAGGQLQRPRDRGLRPADGVDRAVFRGSGQPLRSHRRPAALCIDGARPHGRIHRGLAAVDLAHRLLRRGLEPRGGLRQGALAATRASRRARAQHRRRWCSATPGSTSAASARPPPSTPRSRCSRSCRWWVSWPSACSSSNRRH